MQEAPAAGYALGLPPELSALRGPFLADAVLVEAARLARRWGVGGDEALVAGRLAPAETVYRALAVSTGLPFLDGPVPVHPRARAAEAMRTGLVRLAGDDAVRFATAPRGAAFARLAACAPGTAPPRLALCTPGRLREGVFAARGGHIARQAAETLPRERPADSYYDGVSLAQVLWAAAFGAALAFLAVAVGGTRHAFAALIGLPFLGLAAIKIAASAERVDLPGAALGGPRLPDRVLPVYTVLVPLFREGAVVATLLRALAAIDYPAAKLDVKLLLEEGDTGTAAALAGEDVPPHIEVVTVPPGLPRTKPRALNVGLMLARGRYLVVFDAEDVPDPGQLRAAVAGFAAAEADVACLQARLVVDNTGDGILARFFTVEYGALFDVVNPALPRFDLPVPLGGTSNHLAVAVLRALGGWDPWNVTEDADLAIRLATAGHRVADLAASTTEEMPATLRQWLDQRTRWMKGFLQTTVTHSRRPIRNLARLGPVRLFGASALIFGAVASALVYPVFVLLLVAAALRGELLAGESPADHVAVSLAIVLAGAGGLAMTLPGFVAIARRGWTAALWPYAALMPLYYLLVSVAAWRSLVELALAPDRWNKTEHGLARTSRRLGGGSRPMAGQSRPPAGQGG